MGRGTALARRTGFASCCHPFLAHIFLSLVSPLPAGATSAHCRGRCQTMLALCPGPWGGEDGPWDLFPHLAELPSPASPSFPTEPTHSLTRP